MVSKVEEPNNWGVEASEFHVSPMKSCTSEDGISLLDLKLEIEKSPNIKKFHTFSIQGNTSWMTLILSYLKDGKLPSDLDEARKIKK